MQTESLRIDKWLWHARFYKTRRLAQAAACSGVLRLNNARVEKASVTVRPGDVLTVPHGHREVSIIRIQALGVRRGPAPEAQALYQILQVPMCDVTHS
ncbi:MAG TPA: RNA-binding S4 domain-containing protein [Rhizomicrobium sp.]|jgi:ribosome-associated heat shock protein Hsp15|nr:RNA-binding S4 domain-containing protein [Rhizomicrobium sp.]